MIISIGFLNYFNLILKIYCICLNLFFFLTKSENLPLLSFNFVVVRNQFNKLTDEIKVRTIFERLHLVALAKRAGPDRPAMGQCKPAHFLTILDFNTQDCGKLGDAR